MATGLLALQFWFPQQQTNCSVLKRVSVDCLTDLNLRWSLGSLVLYSVFDKFGITGLILRYRERTMTSKLSGEFKIAEFKIADSK